MAATPSCPTCSATLIPIVYGMPGGDLVDAAERGEVTLGGCLVWEGQPEWWCPECEEPAGGPDGDRET